LHVCGILPLHSEVVAGIAADLTRRFCKRENETVMKEESKVRSIWLTIRLNKTEAEKLNKFYSKTTCNSLSEYGRKVLLQEPVTIYHRNQTADDFLQEMVQLKSELQAIGKNYNQVVKKLHTLDAVPEIKTWALLNESSRQLYFKKLEEIQEKIHKIYTLWSQK
jgi:MobC-like protein